MPTPQDEKKPVSMWTVEELESCLDQIVCARGVDPILKVLAETVSRLATLLRPSAPIEAESVPEVKGLDDGEGEAKAVVECPKCGEYTDDVSFMKARCSLCGWAGAVRWPSAAPIEAKEDPHYKDCHCCACCLRRAQEFKVAASPEGHKPNEALLQAFVRGARWWEFQKTGATMWQSDQRKAYDAAKAKYNAPEGQKDEHK